MKLLFTNDDSIESVFLHELVRAFQQTNEHEIFVVHDLAYADLVFDGYQAPSILQVPIAVDKNNMMDTVIKDGYHKLEEVYQNVPKDQWPK